MDISMDISKHFTLWKEQAKCESGSSEGRCISSISVVITNLVMEDVEQSALATFHSCPHFWKGYIDDTFTVLPCDLVHEFLSHLNSIEACIQFTFEKETEDGKLLFLDVSAVSLTDQCTENQRTPISACPLTHTILWHTRPQW